MLDKKLYLILSKLHRQIIVLISNIGTGNHQICALNTTTSCKIAALGLPTLRVIQLVTSYQKRC